MCRTRLAHYNGRRIVFSVIGQAERAAVSFFLRYLLFSVNCLVSDKGSSCHSGLDWLDTLCHWRRVSHWKKESMNCRHATSQWQVVFLKDIAGLGGDGKLRQPPIKDNVLNEAMMSGAGQQINNGAKQGAQKDHKVPRVNVYRKRNIMYQ